MKPKKYGYVALVSTLAILLGSSVHLKSVYAEEGVMAEKVSDKASVDDETAAVQDDQKDEGEGGKGGSSSSSSRSSGSFRSSGGGGFSFGSSSKPSGSSSPSRSSSNSSNSSSSSSSSAIRSLNNTRPSVSNAGSRGTLVQDSNGRLRNQNGTFARTPTDSRGNRLNLDSNGRWRDQSGRFAAGPRVERRTKPSFSAAEARQMRASGSAPAAISNNREHRAMQTTKFVNNKTVINNTTVINRTVYHPGYSGWGYSPWGYSSFYISPFAPAFYGCIGWCGGFWYPDPFVAALDAAIWYGASSSAYDRGYAAGRAAGSSNNTTIIVQGATNDPNLTAEQKAQIAKAQKMMQKTGMPDVGDFIKVDEDTLVRVVKDPAYNSAKDSGFAPNDRCKISYHGTMTLVAVKDGKAILSYNPPEESDDAWACTAGVQISMDASKLVGMNQRFMARVKEDMKVQSQSEAAASNSKPGESSPADQSISNRPTGNGSGGAINGSSAPADPTAAPAQ